MSIQYADVTFRFLEWISLHFTDPPISQLYQEAPLQSSRTLNVFITKTFFILLKRIILELTYFFDKK